MSTRFYSPPFSSCFSLKLSKILVEVSVVQGPDSNIVVNWFALQSRYYVHFQTRPKDCKTYQLHSCSRLVGWLVGWILWQSNLYWLFNAKFIFKQIVLFPTVQFSMSTQFNCQKHFYFKLFSLFKQFNQLIQFSMSTDFVYPLLNIKTVLY